MSTFRLSASIGNRRRLRKPESHLERLAAWSRSFENRYPEVEPGEVCVDWPFAIDERLVDPPFTTPDLQRRALNLLLAAAGHLRDARPAGLADQQVYVMIPWPAPSGAEIGVFVDPDYGRTFAERTHWSQLWTPLDPAERSLAREAGLSLPDGFAETGYHEISRDAPDDETSVFEREIWLFRERV